MTRPIPLFSMVIFPNSDQSTLIKSYKQLLKNHIGWFGSANAAAHITVINFEDEPHSKFILTGLGNSVRTVISQKVTLNAWDSFGERDLFH